MEPARWGPGAFQTKVNQKTRLATSVRVLSARISIFKLVGIPKTIHFILTCGLVELFFHSRSEPGTVYPHTTFRAVQVVTNAILPINTDNYTFTSTLS